ncbi:MAG: GNAT family N-acetyltransferase [Solobacterium sp.]|nr:GNAT family N-acetyltransferase [Solobacterium sp.]
MSTRIRQASAEDIGLLIGFRKKQLDDEEEHPDRNIDSELQQWFTSVMREGKLYQLILEEDGMPVATGAFLKLDMPPSFFRPEGKILYITNMYTVPSFRCRGYASEILRELKHEAENRGCERLLLSASVWGKNVYERFGFRQSDDWMILNLK